MELFDLYNINNELIGKTMVRGDSNKKGEYHKVVHIWIRNSKDEYLIQQRNKSTDYIPYQWAPTAGSVQTKESSIETALRETYEEIGLMLDPNELEFVDSFFINHPHANFIIDLYMVYKDVDIDALVIDPIEVKNIQFASRKKIEVMVKNNQFWDFKSMVPNYFNILEKR